MKRIPMLLCACGALGAAISNEAAPAIENANVEFFEKKIRPVLAEQCHRCHSHKAEKLKSGLYLDTREGLLKGGEGGGVVVPEAPEKSRLIEAIRYTNPDLQMPPKRKLSDAVVADFTEWVKRGVPWPDESHLASATPNSREADPRAFLEERRRHWAYQPVRSATVPSVSNSGWGSSEVDAFILAKLEAKGLRPAPPADRRTLIRRVTYDLTGLPPTPAEVDDFVRDVSPNAFAKVVDRLLTSPQYGERWARHWLDLVRYSETLGFEFDFDLYNAWRYRDYVIRAFNADLPYDRFVTEHLAGDLLPQPRRDPAEHCNESILATACFWMGEGRQTPVDIRQEQADVIDGQIDVLGKAFLGQTLACARCHDHKFDAITTRDYYALAGFLKSSRYQQAFIDPPARITAKARQLAALKATIRERVVAETAPSWLAVAAQTSRYLLAAREVMQDESHRKASPTEAARRLGVIESLLVRWINALRQPDLETTDHPLHAWKRLAQSMDSTPETFGRRRQALLSELRERQAQCARDAEAAKVFDDFHRPDHAGWHATGDAFGAGPAQSGEIMIGRQAERPVARFVSSGAHSGLLSNRLQGELRSETFTIETPFIHFLIGGERGRLNLIIDNYTLIMNPMYGGLTIAATNGAPAWRTMAVDQWIGHRAFIELSDSTIPIHRLNPPPSDARVPENPDDSFVELNRVCFSADRHPPPSPPHPANLQALENAVTDDAEGLAAAYQKLVVDKLEEWRRAQTGDGPCREESVALLDWLMRFGLLDNAEVRANAVQNRSANSLSFLLQQYREIESSLPVPRRAPALADGTGEDEWVFLRGNYKTLGERVPRREPEVFEGAVQESRPTLGEEQGFEDDKSDAGSGRLELARRLTNPSNPLLARVLVNRLWKHHFGEAIVRTPDDFGRMGQPPTHPELLDYLASEFVRRGWSIKAMHRLMLLTSVYQMSSEPDPVQVRVDPENRLWHHFPVRRLDAEEIRDAILAVSGRLNRALYGPSVLPYLTPYMEGRGRPKSGPLDGEGRRSIYVNARRNFPTPLLVAFDYPVSFSTTGRRDVSTVPDQALTLMNDPFVIQQAGRWAQHALAQPGMSPAQRIDALYQTAFARPPSDVELRQAQSFLKEQARRYDCSLEEAKPWADLCHVLYNVKEFIFLN